MRARPSGDVGDVDLIGRIFCGGNGLAIGDGDKRATVDRVLQGNVTAREVVIQVQGFALFEIDGNQVIRRCDGDRTQRPLTTSTAVMVAALATKALRAHPSKLGAAAL